MPPRAIAMKIREPTAEDFAAKAVQARSEGRAGAADMWDRMGRLVLCLMRNHRRNRTAV